MIVIGHSATDIDNRLYNIQIVIHRQSVLFITKQKKINKKTKNNKNFKPLHIFLPFHRRQLRLQHFNHFRDDLNLLQDLLAR